MVTRLGEDEFAHLGRSAWAAASVTPQMISDPERPTGTACIMVDTDMGKNAIFVSPGAAGALSGDDVVAKWDVFESAAVVPTQLDQPLFAAVATLRIGHAGSANTILNPAPAVPLSDAVLSICDCITPNETEAKILAVIEIDGPDAAVRAGRRLQEAGAGAAVITLGQEGACLVAGDDPVFVPAMPAGAVVDTTGADDAFNDGFAVALSRGASPADAMRFACAVAGISVTREWVGPSMPTAGEVQALLKR